MDILERFERILSIDHITNTDPKTIEKEMKNIHKNIRVSIRNYDIYTIVTKEKKLQSIILYKNHTDITIPHRYKTLKLEKQDNRLFQENFNNNKIGDIQDMILYYHTKEICPINTLYMNRGYYDRKECKFISVVITFENESRMKQIKNSLREIIQKNEISLSNHNTYKWIMKPNLRNILRIKSE